MSQEALTNSSVEVGGDGEAVGYTTLVAVLQPSG